ncbi:hypothetical protein [Ideonella sp.]|jgi:hypothetical protein|uniref:hypothetical protein n=1 Tax=Ideonella sp. TaxID=1929293 RepID=UPI0037C05DFC
MTFKSKLISVGSLGQLFSHRSTRSNPAPPTTSDDLRQINRVVVPVVVGAVLAALWVGWKADAVGPVLLWVFASVVAGGMAGFLFGIPKSGMAGKAEGTTNTTSPNTPAAVAGAAAIGTTTPAQAGGASPSDAATRARPNTNLEEVSDWLTKIIVGLTLVNFTEVRNEITAVCHNAAAAMRPNPTAADVSAATALVVGFAMLGFLAVYLYMRLFVQGAIGRADDAIARSEAHYRDALDYANQLEEKEPTTAQFMSADGSDPVPVVPSAASVSAAQAVADAAPADATVVLQPLRQLAGEYEALRGRKEYSRERTNQMTDIVRRMRPHAIAAAPYIGDLIRSTSTGEHLAATVILQMKYMPDQMEWLARRLVEERAFIGYQAASALLARVRVAGPPECTALKAAVRRAQEERVSSGNVEASLDKLIEQILNAE